MNIKKIKNRFLECLGTYDGIFAYKGPRCVQIDISNKCNNDCIGCWCNSPLLDKKSIPEYITNSVLPTDVVIKLLDDLKKMGTEEIFFAGGGEPFMHPDAVKIFLHAKQCGFHVSINTNFTLVDKDIAKTLVDAKIDHLIVSAWAGKPEIYADTHPNKTADDFIKLKEVLTFLNEYKGGGGELPIVKVYNVVFNMNWHDFENMIQFVYDTGSEATEFTLIDTMPGQTDKLNLSKDEARELLKVACAMKEKWYHKGSGVWLGNYDTFLQRIESYLSEAGGYDKENVMSVPCYAGWVFARIIANGDVNSCLKSHRIPIGNLHEDSFAKIWNNARQQEFRKHTRNLSAEDPYFRSIGNDPDAKIGCFRSCDNIGHSLLLHEARESLADWQKVVLGGVGNVCCGFRRCVDFFLG